MVSNLHCFIKQGVYEAVTGSRSPCRSKKHSLPVTSRPVPVLSLNNFDTARQDGPGDDDDVTKQLETAVRKMSRGSPNLTSPNRDQCYKTFDVRNSQ